MVGVIRKIKMARDWFGRICVVFFLRLVGVRGSGPPIFSLFRLCRFSSIACRFPLRDFALPKNDEENTAIACVVVTRMVSFLLLGFGFSW